MESGSVAVASTSWCTRMNKIIIVASSVGFVVSITVFLAVYLPVRNDGQNNSAQSSNATVIEDPGNLASATRENTAAGISENSTANYSGMFRSSPVNVTPSSIPTSSSTQIADVTNGSSIGVSGYPETSSSVIVTRSNVMEPSSTTGLDRNVNTRATRYFTEAVSSSSTHQKSETSRSLTTQTFVIPTSDKDSQNDAMSTVSDFSRSDEDKIISTPTNGVPEVEVELTESAVSTAATAMLFETVAENRNILSRFTTVNRLDLADSTSEMDTTFQNVDGQDITNRPTDNEAATTQLLKVKNEYSTANSLSSSHINWGTHGNSPTPNEDETASKMNVTSSSIASSEHAYSSTMQVVDGVETVNPPLIASETQSALSTLSSTSENEATEEKYEVESTSSVNAISHPEATTQQENDILLITTKTSSAVPDVTSLFGRRDEIIKTDEVTQSRFATSASHDATTKHLTTRTRTTFASTNDAKNRENVGDDLLTNNTPTFINNASQSTRNFTEFPGSMETTTDLTDFSEDFTSNVRFDTETPQETYEKTESLTEASPAMHEATSSLENLYTTAPTNNDQTTEFVERPPPPLAALDEFTTTPGTVRLDTETPLARPQGTYGTAENDTATFATIREATDLLTESPYTSSANRWQTTEFIERPPPPPPPPFVPPGESTSTPISNESPSKIGDVAVTENLVSTAKNPYTSPANEWQTTEFIEMPPPPPPPPFVPSDESTSTPINTTVYDTSHRHFSTSKQESMKYIEMPPSPDPRDTDQEQESLNQISPDANETTITSKGFSDAAVTENLFSTVASTTSASYYTTIHNTLKTTIGLSSWDEATTPEDESRANKRNAGVVTESFSSVAANQPQSCAELCHIYYNGRCNVIITVFPLAVEMSKIFCKDLGGTLANIYGFEHMETVMEYVRNDRMNVLTDVSLRIGMTYNVTNGDLLYVDGSKADDSKLRWAKEAPLQSCSNCTAVYLRISSNKTDESQYLINDDPKSQRQATACEF